MFEWDIMRGFNISFHVLFTDATQNQGTLGHRVLEVMYIYLYVYVYKMITISTRVKVQKPL